MFKVQSITCVYKKIIIVVHINKIINVHQQNYGPKSNAGS